MNATGNTADSVLLSFLENCSLLKKCTTQKSKK